MAVKYYLPMTEKERAIWFKNYVAKFVGYATILGFTPAEVAAIQNDLAMYLYSLDAVEHSRTESKERVQYKDTLLNGPSGTTIGAFPTMGTLPAPPTLVPAGILPRLTAMVRRIKAHPNYTEAIGKDLGIIGTEKVDTFDVIKPILVISKTGGYVLAKYKRGTTDGIHLFSKRGNETEFTLLAVLTTSQYKDTRPNLVAGQAESRQYQAWYFKNDVRIGQESDIVNIVV